jgi:hypothetical protein
MIVVMLQTYLWSQGSCDQGSRHLLKELGVRRPAFWVAITSLTDGPGDESVLGQAVSSLQMARRSLELCPGGFPAQWWRRDTSCSQPVPPWWPQALCSAVLSCVEPLPVRCPPHGESSPVTSSLNNISLAFPIPKFLQNQSVNTRTLWFFSSGDLSTLLGRCPASSVTLPAFFSF